MGKFGQKCNDFWLNYSCGEFNFFLGGGHFDVLIVNF